MTLINLDNQDMKLKYTLNSICALEEKTGKGIFSLIDTNNFGFNLIRMLIWAGLLYENPALTPEVIGDWIEKEIDKDFENFNSIGEKAMKALTESGVLGKINKQDENKKNLTKTQ